MNYKTYTVRIYENGTKFWLNENGPAIKWADESKWYYLNGKLHRTDGPAKEDADGSKEYWLNGQRYAYDDWKKEVEKSKVKELTVSEASKLLGYEVKIIK